MKQITTDDVKTYVRDNIGAFHSSKLQSLQELKLSQILSRKNPYLFKAKNILLAQDLVKTLLDAHLSSQEETLFGKFLEGLAIFVNQQVYGGRKSSADGMDLEFDKDGVRYLVTVKSGPNWGNSGQISKMKDDFNKAKRIIRTGNLSVQVVPVNGCCYGRDDRPDKGDYYKYCGQRFWEFVSGNKDLYLKIVKPLGYTAKRRNAEFSREYAQIVNRFTSEFSKDFVADGSIDWEKLVEFVSAEKAPTQALVGSRRKEKP